MAGMFGSIAEQERERAKHIKDQIESYNALIGIASALARISESHGYREFKAKLVEMNARLTHQLVSEQDSNQKFRLSGKVEVIGSIVAMVDGASSEATRLTNLKTELENLSKNLFDRTGTRLNPAGGKWNEAN